MPGLIKMLNGKIRLMKWSREDLLRVFNWYNCRAMHKIDAALCSPIMFKLHLCLQGWQGWKGFPGTNIEKKSFVRSFSDKPTKVL